MKQINQLIPQALKAIRANLVKTSNPLQVDAEYKGYIASLGAGIIQSGLIPTLSFYSDASKIKNDDELTPHQKKNKLLQAILYVIAGETTAKEQRLLNYVLVEIDKDFEPQNKNFQQFKFNLTKAKKIEKRILNASIALKLALRSFKQV